MRIALEHRFLGPSDNSSGISARTGVVCGSHTFLNGRWPPEGGVEIGSGGAVSGPSSIANSIAAVEGAGPALAEHSETSLMRNATEER
jgi:hypothetical protein